MFLSVLKLFFQEEIVWVNDIKLTLRSLLLLLLLLWWWNDWWLLAFLAMWRQWYVSSGNETPFDVRSCRTSDSTRSMAAGTVGPAGTTSTANCEPSSTSAIRPTMLLWTPTSLPPASLMFPSHWGRPKQATSSSSSYLSWPTDPWPFSFFHVKKIFIGSLFVILLSF